MSGPTPFLPFFSSIEKSHLTETSEIKLAVVKSGRQFFELFLADGSSVSKNVYQSNEFKNYQEQPWCADIQFKGLWRIVSFNRPSARECVVTDSYDTSNKAQQKETKPSSLFRQEQHFWWNQEEGPQAVWEMRLTATADNACAYPVVVERWSLFFEPSAHSVTPCRITAQVGAYIPCQASHSIPVYGLSQLVKVAQKQALRQFHVWTEEARRFLNTQEGNVLCHSTGMPDHPKRPQYGKRVIIPEKDPTAYQNPQAPSEQSRNHADSQAPEPNIGLPEAPSWFQHQPLTSPMREEQNEESAVPVAKIGKAIVTPHRRTKSISPFSTKDRAVSHPLAKMKKPSLPSLSEPYQVVFYNKEIGLQFESALGIPVVAGVTDFDPGEPPVPAPEELAEIALRGLLGGDSEIAGPVAPHPEPADCTQEQSPSENLVERLVESNHSCSASIINAAEKINLAEGSFENAHPSLVGTEYLFPPSNFPSFPEANTARSSRSTSVLQSDNEAAGVTVISPTNAVTLISPTVNTHKGIIERFEFPSVESKSQFFVSTGHGTKRCPSLPHNVTVETFLPVESFTSENCRAGSPLRLSRNHSSHVDEARNNYRAGSMKDNKDGIHISSDSDALMDSFKTCAESLDQTSVRGDSSQKLVQITPHRPKSNQDTEELARNTGCATIESSRFESSITATQKHRSNHELAELGHSSDESDKSEDDIISDVASVSDLSLVEEMEHDHDQDLKCFFEDANELSFCKREEEVDEQQQASPHRRSMDVGNEPHLQCEEMVSQHLPGRWCHVSDPKSRSAHSSQPVFKLTSQVVVHILKRAHASMPMMNSDSVEMTGNLKISEGPQSVVAVERRCFSWDWLVDSTGGPFPSFEDFKVGFEFELKQQLSHKFELTLRKRFQDTTGEEVTSNDWAAISYSLQTTAEVTLSLQADVLVLGDLGLVAQSEASSSEGIVKSDNVCNESSIESMYQEADSLQAEERGLPNIDVSGGVPKEEASPKPSARLPMIGAVVLAVNGVRTAGLKFEAAEALLLQSARPLTVDFTDSWNSVLDGIEHRERLSLKTVEKKLRHSASRDIQAKVTEFLNDFKQSDLKELMAGPPERGPNKMVWSLIRWVKQELILAGLFNNKHRYGGGLPAMGEKHLSDLLEHLERMYFEEIFSVVINSSPEYPVSDQALREKMGELRFLQPHHFGAEVQYPLGLEWELAQEEFCKILNCHSPIEMLGCVRAAVKMVALSVEASRSRKGKKGAIGADDILPALTWIVVQANPPELCSYLWFMSYYMSEESGISEAGYCLTQVMSVIDYVRELNDASTLTGITNEEYFAAVKAHKLTEKAITAAKAKTFETVSQLLSQGAKVDQLGYKQKHTVLTAAITTGSAELVEMVLRHRKKEREQEAEQATGPGRLKTAPFEADSIDVRVSPHFGDNRGRTALGVAAALGLFPVVLALLHEGANRNVADRNGALPHTLALEGGHGEVATLLAMEPQERFLLEAAIQDNTELVRILLLQGCSPNTLHESGEYTPLMLAAFTGSVRLLKLLLAFHEDPVLMSFMRFLPADPNFQNARGETALMYAVQCRGKATEVSQVEVASTLLKAGANRYIRDFSGESAVDWAVKYGCVKFQQLLKTDPMHCKIYEAAKNKDAAAVEALLSQGVDPNQNPKGYTALIASVFNRDFVTTKLLLHNPLIKMNAKDGSGMSPLMWASKNGDYEMVLLLLKHGVDRWLNVAAASLAHEGGFFELETLLRVDPEQCCICIYASEGNWPVVNALIKQGVSINEKNRVYKQSEWSEEKQIWESAGWYHDMYTALIAACAKGHIDLVRKMLTIPDIDVNLPNLLGETPLMYSAALGSEELVLLLLSHGANRYLLDNKRRRASDWCKDQGNLSLAAVLHIDPAKRSIQRAAAEGKTSQVVALVKQGVSANDAMRIRLRDIVDRIKKNEEAKNVQRKASQLKHKIEKLECKKPFYPPDNVQSESLEATPLMFACCFNHVKTVRYLIRCPEVQINLQDKEGRSALMHAARCGAEECVLELLATNRCRRRLADHSLGNATDLAISGGFLSVAALVQANPDKLPIWEVAQTGSIVLVNALLRQGISVNASDFSRPPSLQTPLIAAASSKKMVLVRFLLRLPRIKVNKRNSNGETALMHAAAVDLDIAKVLLENGANASLKDDKGLTAEHWAYYKGYMNLIQFKILLISIQKTMKSTKQTVKWSDSQK